MPISCKCILDHLKYKQVITEKEYDKLLRNLKGTDWHPYPKEKPTECKEYNITLKHTKCTTTADYDPEYDEWRGNDNFYIPHNCISAWAELPEPYEEGAECYNKDTNGQDNVIVVQLDCLMPVQRAASFRKDLLAQMKDGIIVIPSWAHVTYVGDECTIEIKEMKECNRKNLNDNNETNIEGGNSR